MIVAVGGWLGWIITGIILFVVGIVLNRLWIEGIGRTIGYILFIIGIILIIIGFVLLVFGLL